MEKRPFVGGLQRDGAAGISLPASPEKLNEGIVLKLSPLLTFDGNAVDAMIDLTVNTLVRSFHRTKVIAPRDDRAAAEPFVEVPTSTETHLDQTVKNWPLAQTLVISGVPPGILDKKSGLFNLPIPGTFPPPPRFWSSSKWTRSRAGPRATRAGRAPAPRHRQPLHGAQPLR